MIFHLRRSPVFLLLLLAQLCLTPLSSQEEPAVAEKDVWLTDYKLAVQKAMEEKKGILLLFTGTDWIEICQIFDREIATTPEFLEAATERFVLVELQYPKDNRLPRELAAQNQLLRDAYRVRGFPTLVLTYADGRPFGLNGYQPIEPKEYAKQIVSMAEAGKQKNAIRNEAAGLEGMEKAKKLIEGIPDLPGNLSARYYLKEMSEVIRIDESRELPETKQFVRLIADVDYSNEMQKLAKDVQWAKMIQLTEQYISEFGLEGPPLQKALLNKAGVQAQQANEAGRIETLLSVVEIDPATPYGKEAQRQLDVLRAGKLEETLPEQP